jgi:hypothetical protein
MGLFRAFFKGLFGDSPQKFIADIMNLYFNAMGRGYTHEKSMKYVIQSRYPYSDLKRKWIELRLRIIHNDKNSNEKALKELVFAIWLLETTPESNPGDADSLYVMSIMASVNNDPILSIFFDEIDKVYDYLTSTV